MFLITMGLFTFCLGGWLYRAFYLEFHENYIEKSVIELFEYMEEDFENIEEAIEWTSRAINMRCYYFEDVDDFIANVPSYVNPDDVLSYSEQQEIEKGNYIVKNLKTTDFQINVLAFYYPIEENGKVEHLLVTYLPVNNPSIKSICISLIGALLAMVVALMTFWFAKKSFGRSDDQLQEIKQAAKEVSSGNFDIKIGKNSKDELGEIIDVFNQMSTALKINQKRLKEFLEDISHEIKTPLTYIKTYNQALLDGLIQDPQEQYKSYRLIDRETSRLQKLIQALLDFTKLDANAIELNKQPIVFAQSIEEIMMKYEPIFQQQQIQFKMLLDYDVVIEGDEERIEQIIQNIVQNAIRYSKENPCIELKLSRQGDVCTLSISDNGVGISKEHLSIITNRFVRVNKVRSRKESGTGIGLSIVEKLMILHGGEMKIESELGVGTTVNMTFPCIEID
ncbi:HAMP domain-containing histidine kinase [Bacillus sp. AGMB 02131]|uniref:histidine kinase n=1 Tax=Peribacillus faecalis TaxID=2772559 RepID=A0A927CX97_9BACI|nr:HAMP domain-containing sensor histidine kinase [Peribacillus faecalis]MBD3109276.1 HAMP domain-containing histidine kinase [Peribacillus faecalis]